MATAIRIVSVNNDQIQLEEKSLEKILLKSRKIVPISIIGPMRTGKSFMLNYFLQYLRAQYVSYNISKWLGDKNEPLKGFKLSANVDRATDGIMMWSEVFLYDSPEHGKLAIVLMETQGLHHHNKKNLKENSGLFV